MARFVKIGKNCAMINVEQIAYIEPDENKNEYTIHMINGIAYCVTYDEFLEITGQHGYQEGNKKYAIKVFSGDYPVYSFGKYLVFNRETGAPVISTNDDDSGWQAHFTEKEIEKLKNDKDLAIDWDKVELEEVEDE